jgi:hypothetical protein
MPEPSEPIHLFHILQEVGAGLPTLDGQKGDFNYAATWMKHGAGVDEVDIYDIEVVI